MPIAKALHRGRDESERAMLWISKEGSTLFYSVLDELFGFARRLLFLASFIGIIRFVRQIPSELSGSDGAFGRAVVLLIFSVLMTFAAAVVTSHKIRQHAAVRYESVWTPKRNHVTMFAATAILMLVGLAVIDIALDIVLPQVKW